MKNRRLELVKKKFISDKGMWLAVAYLLFIIVIAVGIKFTDLDPNAMNLQKMLAAPDEVNLFGTDELGRDYLTRVIYGARVSLLVGVLAMITGFADGGIVGGKTTVGDYNLIRANKGEMILNNKQQAHLFRLLDGGSNLASTNGEVKFKISGKELIGVLNNFNSKKSKVM